MYVCTLALFPECIHVQTWYIYVRVCSSTFFYTQHFDIQPTQYLCRSSVVPEGHCCTKSRGLNECIVETEVFQTSLYGCDVDPRETLYKAPNGAQSFAPCESLEFSLDDVLTSSSSNARRPSSRINEIAFNRFGTAVPFWGQPYQILSNLSQKRDCGSKKVNWPVSWQFNS